MNIEQAIKNFNKESNVNTRRALRKALKTAKIQKLEIDSVVLEGLLNSMNFERSNVKGIYYDKDTMGFDSGNIYFFEPTQEEKVDLIIEKLSEGKHPDWALSSVNPKRSTYIDRVSLDEVKEKLSEIDAKAIIDMTRYHDGRKVMVQLIVALYPEACDLFIEE